MDVTGGEVRVTGEDGVPIAEQPAEIVVSSNRDWTACLERVAAAPMVGLDTEFVGEGRYRPMLCLVQLALPDTLYLIDPYAITNLNALWQLLLDKTVVVHGGREDIRIWTRQVGQPPDRIVDVQIAAGFAGFDYPVGYARLVEKLFDRKLGKELTLSDWRRRPLTQAQLEYAFDDVRYLLPAYIHLRRQLHQQGRWEWVEEECRAATQQAIAVDDHTANWHKLKGASRLNPQQLTILRELYLWREEYAARINRPAWVAVRDRVLVRIARMQPTSRRDLAGFRDVPQHVADELLDAVERGSRMPPEKRPSDPKKIQKTDDLTAVCYLLHAVIQNWCRHHHIAPGLAVSPTELKQWAYAYLRQEPWPELSLTRGWRAATILPRLQEVLEGKYALRFVPQNPPHSAVAVVPWPGPPTDANGTSSGLTAEEGTPLAGEGNNSTTPQI